MANWRGVNLDDRSAAMMDEVNRLTPDSPIDPTQGSWSGSVSASAGTHSGCGAIDIAAVSLTPWQRDNIVHAMRQVGWAAWLRTPAQSDWPYHIHGIAVQPGGKWDRGCLHYSAHDQVVDYYDGRNGLASGAPDDGPRQYVGTTWETYQQQPGPEPEPERQPEPEEDYMAFVIVDRQGLAVLVNGPYISIIHDGDDLNGFMDSGIPVVHGLSGDTFNATKARPLT